MRSRQRGLAGALVAVVLLIAAVIALATLALSRLDAKGRAADQTTGKLTALSAAMEQFVASTGRLPCPANPALPQTDAAWGDEVVPAPNVGLCSHPEGTVPWRTIGARQEDAADAWGWKISYRVYSGSPSPGSPAPPAGSLTQAGGATMVKCDLFQAPPDATTPLSGVAGGLCTPEPDPPPFDLTQRDTSVGAFLANKGLAVSEESESGAALKSSTDVAYVLLSHGSTGIGGYTLAGLRNSLPTAGAERNNVNATGPFLIRPDSAPGTDPTTPGHFDDRLLYRTLPELIRRTGLGARQWEDPQPGGNTAWILDKPTLETATGGPISPDPTTGSIGQVTVTFTGAVATGVANGIGTDLSFGQGGGYAGIGVAGGGSALIQSAVNEFVIFQFSDGTNTKFAATLGDFGTYGTFSETVIFAFFTGGVGGTNVANKGGLGCNIDGGLASFTMDVGAAYDTVVVLFASAFDSSTATFSGLSAFLVNEVATCPSSATTCFTSLTDVGNTCPVF